jgi:threonyl-tRNA synthetase
MNAKIRDAQNQKIPYMLVIGDREAEAGAVAVRLRSGEDLKAIPVGEFLSMVQALVSSKSTELR